MATQKKRDWINELLFISWCSLSLSPSFSFYLFLSPFFIHSILLSPKWLIKLIITTGARVLFTTQTIVEMLFHVIATFFSFSSSIITPNLSFSSFHSSFLPHISPHVLSFLSSSNSRTPERWEPSVCSVESEERRKDVSRCLCIVIKFGFSLHLHPFFFSTILYLLRMVLYISISLSFQDQILFCSRERLLHAKEHLISFHIIFLSSLPSFYLYFYRHDSLVFKALECVSWECFKSSYGHFYGLTHCSLSISANNLTTRIICSSFVHSSFLVPDGSRPKFFWRTKGYRWKHWRGRMRRNRNDMGRMREKKRVAFPTLALPIKVSVRFGSLILPRASQTHPLSSWKYKRTPAPISFLLPPFPFYSFLLPFFLHLSIHPPSKEERDEK